jgi:hypothetical protein
MFEGMDDRTGGRLARWEAEWALFGPIPNEGDSSSWPGEIGFAPLALDGATEIPERVLMRRRTYEPLRVVSTDGCLDLARIFDYRHGCPIAYVMGWVDVPSESRVPISFGANWGVQWWVNGELVYETREGNFAAPDLVTGHQFYARLRPGPNLLVVRVVSGGPGWSLCLAKLPSEPIPALPARDGLPAPGPRPAPAGSRDYTRAGLRIEERPGPAPLATAEMRERVMAEHGVEAHWIGIVDPTGSPYGPSAFLPDGPNTEPAHHAQLRLQVAEIHDNGMAAMTWFPGTHCRSAAEAHPDWRVRPLHDVEHAGEADWSLCVLSPYGEALVGFVTESLARYDLDGFWFDGARWSHAGAGACVCDHCRQAFHEAEGLGLPEEEDWDDPAWQRWVVWRTRAFMGYWGQLAARVRRERPGATIVVNHLHRLGNAWDSAIPIDTHQADVVIGTEAQDSPFDSAFHADLVRAYGRGQAEVWMGLHKLFTRNPAWPEACQPVHRYMHHALCCMTAGVMPSFGTPDPGEKPADAYAILAGVINARRPYVTGRSAPALGLWLSQQAETFHFSRRTGPAFPDAYWHSVVGWRHLLGENQLPVDIVFDSRMTAEELSAYPALAAPLAVCVSDAQIAALTHYVEQGGRLIVDRWFGACDAWGGATDPWRMQRLLGRAAQAPPAVDGSDLDPDDRRHRIRELGDGRVAILGGNVGLRFHRWRSPVLSAEVGELVRHLSRPRLEVDGPRRLQVGLFEDTGRLLLHLQNFIAYSASERFPNPVLCAPEPIGPVHVRLSGYKVRWARRVLADSDADLALSRCDEAVSFVVPGIEWGELIEIGL